jgi:hypothetical protein
MVSRGIGLQADEARRQVLKKPHDLAAPRLLAHNDLLVAIYAVNLEHVLGDIQTDCGNLHLDGSLVRFVATITSLAIRCWERAPSTTSLSTRVHRSEMSFPRTDFATPIIARRARNFTFRKAN